MQLLSRANPDSFNRASRRNRRGQIDQPHAGDLRDEYFAAMHLLDGANHETNSMLESQPETGHARIGDGNAATLALLLKHRDHAAPATDNVSVASATEASLLRSRIRIRLN